MSVSCHFEPCGTGEEFGFPEICVAFAIRVQMSLASQSIAKDLKCPFSSTLVYSGEVFLSQRKVTSHLLSPFGTAIYHSVLCYFKPFSTLHLEHNGRVNEELENKRSSDYLLYSKNPKNKTGTATKSPIKIILEQK